MYIQGDGRVGIGTVSPQSRLDVDGIVRVSRPTITAKDCNGPNDFGGVTYSKNDSHFFGCTPAGWKQLD